MRLRMLFVVGFATLAAVVVITMAGGGDDPDPRVAAGGSAAHHTAPSEMACGGFRFPASALTAAPEPAQSSHPAVGAMRALLSGAAGRVSFEATSADVSQVRVLSEGDGHALVGVGDPSAPGYTDGPPTFVVVRLEPAGETWEPVEWSGCSLRVGADPPSEDAPVRWYPTGEVTQDSTSIPIAVLEQACAGGQVAEGRVRRPVIEYRADAVVVSVTVEARGGFQTCPGNPPTPYVLELAEPLGDRALLDGGRYPPAPPADPDPPPPPLSDLPIDALQPSPQGNVTLLVANESETVDPVELHHMITGAVLPEATYRREQGWVEYRFDLPPGLHQISVAAVGPDGGGQDGMEELFEVTGQTWLVLRYSGDGGAGSLTFSAHDEPPPEAGE